MKEYDPQESLNENSIENLNEEELSSEESLLTESEIDDAVKKKREDDIYGIHYQKEQEEKHREEGIGALGTQPYDISGFFSDAEDDEAEPEPEEELNEKYGKDSIGLTITSEIDISDDHLHGVFDNQSPESKLIINGYAMEVGFNELHNDMSETMSQLLENSGKVQGVVRGNTMGRSSVADDIDGPDDFKEIVKAMDEYSDLYNKREINGVTLEQLGRKYDNLMNMTQKYLKDHKPRIRGHRSAQSEANYKTLQRFLEKGKIGVNTINTLGREINASIKKDMANESGEGISLKDMKLSELGSTLINRFSPGSEEFTKNYIDIAKVKMGNQRTHEEINLNKRRVLNNLKAASKGDNSVDFEGYFKTGRLLKGAEPKAHACAVGYMSKSFLDGLRDENTSLADLKTMQRQLRSNQFARQVEGLSKNPVFQGAVYADAGSFGRWGMVQNRTSEIIKANRNDLKKLYNKTSSDYNREGTMSINSDVAVNFMMGLVIENPKCRQFVESIAAQEAFDCPFGGNRTYASLQEKLSKLFENPNGILKNFIGKPLNNIPQLVEYLNSDEVMNEIAKQAKREAYLGMKASAKNMKRNVLLRRHGKAPTAENERISKYRKALLAREKSQKKSHEKSRTNKGAGRSSRNASNMSAEARKAASRKAGRNKANIME